MIDKSQKNKRSNLTFQNFKFNDIGENAIQTQKRHFEACHQNYFTQSNLLTKNCKGPRDLVSYNWGSLPPKISNLNKLWF